MSIQAITLLCQLRNKPQFFYGLKTVLLALLIIQTTGCASLWKKTKENTAKVTEAVSDTAEAAWKKTKEIGGDIKDAGDRVVEYAQDHPGRVAAASATAVAINSSLIPSGTFTVSKTLALPVEGAVAGALVYVIVDPLSPNWDIEEAYLPNGRVRIALKRKVFITGGDGEAYQVFQRQAERIALEHGTEQFLVRDYSEGIESHTMGTRKVARGSVEVLMATSTK